MPAFITAVYPNTTSGSFNLEYYVSTHMPLVHKKFQQYGMKNWRVQKIQGTASGDPSPYWVHAILEFDNEDQIHQAFQNESETVMADIPNFTDLTPVIMIGSEVSAS